MQTVADLIAGGPPLPPQQRKKFLTSTSTTTPRYPRTDLDTLARWDIATDIAGIADSFRQPLPGVVSLGPYDLDAVNDEESVRANVKASVLKSVLKCLKPFDLESDFSSTGGNEHVVGAPDFVYHSGGSKRPKIAIEAKTDWAFPQSGSILADWPPGQNYPRTKLVRVIQQLYGYMTFNYLRFGILTNYTTTWFLRRVHSRTGGRLEISDAFPITQTPKLIHAYVTVAILAEDEWFYASPTTSPAPQRRVTATTRPTPVSDPYVLQSIDIAGIHFSKGVDRSRVGVVVRGTYLGASVIMKVVDASKQQWAVDELDAEVAAYCDLDPLANTYLPRVLAYVEVWEMLRILILEDCGENLATYEKRGGNLDSVVKAMCNRCLAAVNALGYVHNDVKRQNFVIDPTGVIRLIDLGQARKGTATEVIDFA
ncbi:hypothetical protein HDU89_008922 [Geranomyces variabilis]|nr:hypothetical protein HDU89_008922 [Geranomyces variabilis]